MAFINAEFLVSMLDFVWMKVERKDLSWRGYWEYRLICPLSMFFSRSVSNLYLFLGGRFGKDAANSSMCMQNKVLGLKKW